MEDSITSVFSMLCTAALCLLPLVAIAGGVWFFVNKKKKAQPVSAAMVSSIPQAPRPPAPAPAAYSSPAPDAQVAPQYPTAPQAASALFTGALSPSELLYLRADNFVASAGAFNSEKVMGTEVKVKGPELAKLIFATAFAALQQAGHVRLQTGNRKALLGLRSPDTIFLVPTGLPGQWPEGSYEDKFLAMAQSLAPSEKNTVDQLVYQAMENDNTLPWQQVFIPLRRSLGQRGVLGTEEKKTLMLKTKHYALSPEARSAIAAMDISGIQNTLSTIRSAQPEVWETLNKEIKIGIDRRQEASDND